ncbi:polysaccharide biosynthesis/export family protein [Cupriavidus basilensis]
MKKLMLQTFRVGMVLLALFQPGAFAAEVGMARTALSHGAGGRDSVPAAPGLAVADARSIGLASPAAAGTLPQADTSPLASAPQALPAADYQANLGSEVFGASMFSGAFARAGSIAFNPDYVIANGDQVRVRMWGGFDFDAVLPVDEQGNIFLPHVGPMRVRGIHNGELQAMVTAALRKSYSARVEIYASLVAAQPVRVYVTGFVRRPGIYEGNSNDSPLRFIDLAGGIDPDRGSFLQVEIQRGGLAEAGGQPL